MRALALAALVACEDHPTPTGTVCPDPDPVAIGYATAFDLQCTPTDGSGDCFGKTFMDTYCVQCHDHLLKGAMRNGAPFLHDFDTLEGVLEPRPHIDEQTGIGPDAENRFMPPARCPSVPGGPLDTACKQPTDDERRQLAVWIACTYERKYQLRDAGIDAPPD